ncbi:hypothetical protein KZJ38_29230 [Paraburkholderia edwinii]|uniref:Secreted protein n=1 Tax=Paraburkholderia edwinii TaxID=2861782 RepID=A0ABX8V3P1_9BURK|nr:hypothetical protein [Paraburkholderia edwinii]QYD73688.1 hypothetical protein KZJ38_29230 [Paraburkholderia edwinii]
MKGFVVPIALTGALLLLQAASSQAQDEIPEDYAYLTHINVRPAVINCIAEIDRWIRTATRYDTFLAPDVRLLKAKIADVDSSAPASSTQGVTQSAAPGTEQSAAQSVAPSTPQTGTPEPATTQVDSMVTIHGSARTRKHNHAWVPAIARCGFWHSHVVSVTLEPFAPR